MRHSLLCVPLRHHAPNLSGNIDTCNRSFLSDTCFQNHLTLRGKGKLVCAWKKICKTWSPCYINRKHECFKRFCNVCNKLRPTGHFCNMSPLKPSKLSNKYMYVFYDIECSEDLKRNQGSLNMYRIFSAPSRCPKCESNEDLNIDCEQCGERTHVSWQDPLGKFISARESTICR